MGRQIINTRGPGLVKQRRRRIATLVVVLVLIAIAIGVAVALYQRGGGTGVGAHRAAWGEPLRSPKGFQLPWHS
jgi:hypothetical protein